MKLHTKNIRFRVIPILFMALMVTFAVAIQPVSASWTQASISGVWQQCSKVNFGQTDFWHEEYEILEYTQTIQNFSGYALVLNTMETQAIARGFGHTGNMHAIVGIGFFVGEEARGIIRLHYDTSQNILGKQTNVNMGSSGQFTDINVNFAYSYVILSTVDTKTTVQYMNIIDTSAFIELSEIGQEITTYFDSSIYPKYTQTFDTDLFCETVTIKFYVACSGSGTFNWKQEGETIFTGGQQPEALGNVRVYEREGFFDPIFNFINSITSFLFDMSVMLYQVIAAFLPYIGAIFFIYILDAIIESIDQGSPQPIGRFFSWIWSMLQDVWSRIIGIAQAIAEAIPF